MAISAAAATVIGGLATLLVPTDRPHPTTNPVSEGAERLPLGASEHAVWLRTVELPGLGRIVAAGAVLTVVLGGVALLGGVGVGVILLVTLAVVTLLLLLLGRWTITVDHVGLTARSVPPRPLTVMPLNEVEAAEVINVQPLADFGGWGYRIDLTGRVDILLCKGEAILVHRTRPSRGDCGCMHRPRWAEPQSREARQGSQLRLHVIPAQAGISPRSGSQRARARLSASPAQAAPAPDRRLGRTAHAARPRESAAGSRRPSGRERW